ncbi:MAG TPA: carbon-nitrogen hydrolase family protein [Bryobacteraceae bacterium]|jgi:nitrilase
MQVRVAVVQDAPQAFNAASSVELVVEWIGKAAAAGAKLVLFPEAFLGGGYPKGLDFGARVGMRSDEGRRHFQLYFDNAIEVPGRETSVIAEAARTHSLWVVAGVIERDGGTLYCTVLFFSPDGELRGKHRKLMPTAMERLIWGFGDGSTIPVIDSGGIGKLGAVICWENYMPLLRMAMYSQGVQLYCAPTVDDRETWLPTMRHIAIEGRCFVLSACQFATRAHFPEWHPDAPVIRGGSVIVDPFGKILAGPLRDEAGMLTADLDLDEIARGKYDLDTTGHYARPDVFTLTVNRTAASPVQFKKDV